MSDHRNPEPKDVLSFGPFSLFVAERLLKKGDEPIPLGGRALDILIALAEQAGEVVSHKKLISSVWPDVTVEEANLRFQIAALRKALGDGRYISNIAGRGYCFVVPVTRSSARQTAPVTGTTTTERVQKLPPRLARMVGRDDTVRALTQQLQEWRFVSIVGPGGVGKTTVAISVAHALVDGFQGAVFFIDLAALTDPQLVPTAIASALGFMVQTQDPVIGLLAFIGDRKILLVLDNCEHVIGVAAALAERVVSETPQAHVLATSREALRVEGEHVHLLYSLDCPPEDAGLTAMEALRYPAAQLFMERAAASGYGAELNDIDAPIVARSCRRLDGVALAIELAASRVGSLGIRGVAELLDNRFGLLWQGRRTALARHETLNAMLDWSYSLLSEREKVVLCRLSVFVGNQKKVWGSKEELPFMGGALATGGGLVFHGNIQGWFKALDAKTGEELWKFNAGSGISQGAITFELDGRQYIAVVSGRLKTPPSFLGHTGERIFASSPEGGALFVFELPD